MSSSRPSRRRSPAVYRRRRLVLVLVVLLIAAAGTWLAIAQPWNAAGDPSPSATPAAESEPSVQPTPEASTEAPADPTPSPSPSSTPEVRGCTADQVVVTPLTDKETYQAGEYPVLTMELKNTSALDCTIDVGTATQRFVVSSGSDVWWRSTDCQSEPMTMLVLLEAGTTVSSSEGLTWDRTRSSTATCDEASRPRAAGDGASYHLAVEIGGVKSLSSRQFFLY